MANYANKKMFWLVWNPANTTMPSVRHTTYTAAKTEAERLASVNPGKSFFVMCAVSLSVSHRIETFDLKSHPTDADDEMPF